MHLFHLLSSNAFLFQFQLDTEQLSETLYKLDKSLESNSGSQRNKAAALMQLEVRDVYRGRGFRKNVDCLKLTSNEELLFFKNVQNLYLFTFLEE